MEKVFLEFIKYEHRDDKVTDIKYCDIKKTIKYKTYVGDTMAIFHEIKFIDKKAFKEKNVFFFDIKYENSIYVKLAFVAFGNNHYSCLRYYVESDEYIITGKNGFPVFSDEQEGIFISKYKDLIRNSYENIEELSKLKLKRLLNKENFVKSIRNIRNFI